MGASHNQGMGATAPAGRSTRGGHGGFLDRSGARGWAFLLASSLLALCACRAPILRTGHVDASAAEQATRSGDWELAADLWYRVYLAQRGSEVRAYYETARALLHTGDRDSACALLDQGLQVFPDHPDLLELRARVLAESGFRRAAEEALSRVVAQQPARVSALGALARIRMQLGLERRAIEPLQSIVRITGGDAETYHLLADALRISQRPVEAYDAYVAALERGANSHALLLQAAQLAIEPAVRKARPEALQRAEAWLDQVASEDPQSASAHFVRAILYEALNREEDALRCYRRAVELDLAHLDALTNLALLHARRGEVEPTREMVERALALETRPGRRSALSALVARAESVAAERAAHAEDTALRGDG